MYTKLQECIFVFLLATHPNHIVAAAQQTTTHHSNIVAAAQQQLLSQQLSGSCPAATTITAT